MAPAPEAGGVANASDLFDWLNGRRGRQGRRLGVLQTEAGASRGPGRGARPGDALGQHEAGLHAARVRHRLPVRRPGHLHLLLAHQPQDAHLEPAVHDLHQRVPVPAGRVTRGLPDAGPVQPQTVDAAHPWGAALGLGFPLPHIGLLPHTARLLPAHP
ncbi:hypothetical protein FOCC_FOCC002371, partial [Frankliniella occidentalis]